MGWAPAIAIVTVIWSWSWSLPPSPAPGHRPKRITDQPWGFDCAEKPLLLMPVRRPPSNGSMVGGCGASRPGPCAPGGGRATQQSWRLSRSPGSSRGGLQGAYAVSVPVRALCEPGAIVPPPGGGGQHCPPPGVSWGGATIGPMSTRYTGFVAKFAGSCADCDEPVRVGRKVRYNDSGDLVHFLHPRVRLPEQTVACTGCHLVGVLVGGLCPDCRYE